MAAESPISQASPTEYKQHSNIKLLGWFVFMYALVALVLLSTGTELFEHLHLLFDTSNGLLSLLLALFLLAEQSRIAPNVRKYLVICFGFAAGTEILHALVGIEWSGWMAWATNSSHILRPATWPPSAYVLPLGLIWSAYLIKRGAVLPPVMFAAGMGLLIFVLFVLAFSLPKYVDTGILGIYRPTQFPLLLILVWMFLIYWRERRMHALFEGIALMGVLLFLSDCFMLFSTSPHEKFTMVAHAGKLFAYAFLHTVQMRVAADDSRARTVAEAALKESRDGLEVLVQQRTEELLATEARASQILNASADGMFGLDLDGRITFMNPAGCAILGYRAEEIVGQLAHPLFHHSRLDGSAYSSSECPSLQALRNGKLARVDNEVYWRADGHPVPVMYAVHPLIIDGQVIGGVTSFVDMTVQRATAEAREQALIAAENLARMRSEFLSNMSHEIRTPLNGVLGFADIGYRNYQNHEKARNAFAKIRDSGVRLLGVVNEVLDFSKIEAGKLHIEHVETHLHQVISQSVDLVHAQASAKQIILVSELVPGLPETCISDPLRLGQILLNLLSNAVKFTEEGQITLVAELVGDTLVFSVSDTGIGMTEEQVAQLFNPFHQVDGSISRRFGGTGLGLAICKRLVELMGGDIRVESTAGVGSKFIFQLPFVPLVK
jgi:PAS domain S-box-containing protein